MPPMGMGMYPNLMPYPVMPGMQPQVRANQTLCRCTFGIKLPDMGGDVWA